MRTVIWVSLLMLSNCLPAQTIGRTEFFGAPIALSTDTVHLLSERNMPWIERYEARTETRDFDAGSQEFTLRLLPNTPGKRRAQQAYYDALAQQPDRRNAELACAVTTARYEDWLRLYAAQEELVLVRRLLANNADRRRLSAREIAAQDIDLNRLFNLQTRATDLHLRASQLTALTDDVLATYGLTGDSLDFTRFILPATLLDELPQPADFVATDRTLETEYELSLLKKELALEEKERKQYIDFVQFKYRGPQAELFREKFSVGLGFQLQDRGADKIKQRELELDQYALNARLRSEREAQARRSEAFARYTDDWEAAYANRVALYLEEDQALTKLAKSAASKVPANLALLLDIDERRVRNQVNLLRARIDLVEEYLDFLSDTEQLCSRPDGEWLYQP